LLRALIHRDPASHHRTPENNPLKQKKQNGQERKAKHRELEQQLAERQEELARLGVEEQSLVRVKAEQEALLARLTESGGGGAF
jgi:mevalonate kinase